ncbi:type III secretion system translocon subunit SctE [Pinirhizobacter sp.]|uniref:type III secretion system translocon subunit SctE n=1 Tax=Pinirhizobacter sp. TaxID=2950432 RepID=UPI002F412686
MLGSIHKATEALLATRADAALGPSRSQHGVEGVALREPSANTIQAEAEKGLSAKAALLKLLAELQAVLNDVSLSSLMNKLKNHLMRIQSQGSQLAQLGADLEAALAAQDAAAQAGTEAAGMAEAAEAEARMARKEVQRLRQELAAATPGSPEHDALTANLKAAEGHASALQVNAMEALANAADAIDHLNGIQEDVQQLQLQARPGVAGSEDHIGRTQSTISRKTEALAKLNDLLAQLSQEDLTRQSETIQMQLKAAEEANQKRAREYEAEVKKAKDLQEKMGCWGKIVGWVVTVVSVVAAPFTGGASLALAAIGLALAIAEEVTGFSVLGAALSPLIENVLMPMMKFLTDVFVSVVEGVADLIGVDIDKQALNLAATILGAIAAVAIIIAVAVVAKSGASKFMEKFGNEIIKNVAKNMGALVPAAVKSAAKSASQSFSRIPAAMSKAFADTHEKAAIRMTYVSDAATVGMAANQTAQGAGGVAVADMQRKAAEIEGQMMMSFANSRILRDLMQQAVDTFVASNATVENVRQMISRLFAQHHSAGVFIAQQMRA